VNSLWNGQAPLLQEMCLLLVKWFHWILSEFIKEWSSLTFTRNVSFVGQVVSLDFE
jgi:hypothetical protein